MLDLKFSKYRDISNFQSLQVGYHLGSIDADVKEVICSGGDDVDIRILTGIWSTRYIDDTNQLRCQFLCPNLEQTSNDDIQFSVGVL